jgi:hypothetical protein
MYYEFSISHSAFMPWSPTSGADSYRPSILAYVSEAESVRTSSGRDPVGNRDLLDLKSVSRTWTYLTSLRADRSYLRILCLLIPGIDACQEMQS